MTQPPRRLAALAAAVLLVASGAGAAAPGVHYAAVPAGPALQITVEFLAFNRQPLALAFRLDGRAPAEAMAEFGYSAAERKALLAECSAAGCGQDEFDRRVDRYYRERGVQQRRQPGGRAQLWVDMPAAVARNARRVRPLAAALSAQAERLRLDPDALLGAAVALVQTALPYREPPRFENGRDILGFYPPPQTLAAGFGDCDSKSALLAALLKNFPGARMIGVHIPGHYLVGIARVPRSGEAFVEHDGSLYVLIETSGPGAMPVGMVAEVTLAALAAGQDVRIDPLF